MSSRKDAVLPDIVFDGEIFLAHGRIVLRDPNEDFKMEVPVWVMGKLMILVDDRIFPASATGDGDQDGDHPFNAFDVPF